jgi:hypothetical protein
MREVPFVINRRVVLTSSMSLLALQSGRSWACHEPSHPCTGTVALPLTGPLAPLGQQAKAGVDAMRDQLQEIDRNGRGRLNTSSIDTDTSVDAAVQAIRMDLEREKPPILIAADFILPSPLLAELALRHRTPFLSVTTTPGTGDQQWIYYLQPTISDVAKGIRACFAAIGAPTGQAVDLVYTPPRAQRVNALAQVLSLTIGRRIELAGAGADSWEAQLTTQLSVRVPAALVIISVPSAQAASMTRILGNIQSGSRFIIDALLADPEILPERPGSLLLSIVSPEVLLQRPFATAIDKRFYGSTRRGLTPVAALTATAWHLVCKAVAATDFNVSEPNEAARQALRNVSLSADESILPGTSISFDPETHAWRNASVVALARQDGRVKTISRPE